MILRDAIMNVLHIGFSKNWMGGHDFSMHDVHESNETWFQEFGQFHMYTI